MSWDEMRGTYNYRKVERDNFSDDFFISTAYVTDEVLPFETAVMHPNYNNGQIVIVEHYASREEAIDGHQKWKELMTSEKLPDNLIDCIQEKICPLIKR